MALVTAASVGLVEACEDRRLLNLALSEKQRVFLRLIEDFQTVIGAGGRQGGKTTLVAAACVHNLLLSPELDALQHGTRFALAVANSKEQASLLVNYARSFIEGSRLLRSQLVSALSDRLILKRDRVLIAMPCSDRLMRGMTASFVGLDELAHFLDSDGSPQAAERVYAAVRPSLATYGRAGRLVAISTPLGQDGLFAQLHARASSGELPGAAAFTASSLELNPRLSEEFLESERIALGELDFAREYLSQFTGGSAAFFEEEAVWAVTGRYRELPPSEGAGWVVGFDPSFSVDPSACAVVGRSKSNPKHLLVARTERWQPRLRRFKKRAHSTYARQAVVGSVLDAVALLAKRYGAVVVTDQHAPATVIEGLRSRGVSHVRVRSWTGQGQTDAFRALRAHIYQGSISLPDSPELTAELRSITTSHRAGSSQVRIPRTGQHHCDMAVSLAMGVQEVERRPPARRALSGSVVLAREQGRLPRSRPGDSTLLLAQRRRTAASTRAVLEREAQRAHALSDLIVGYGRASRSGSPVIASASDGHMGGDSREVSWWPSET
jgi:phage terminase large subunit-like protein